MKICELVCASTEQFPNKSVFIKTVSVTSSNLQSMLFITVAHWYSMGHVTTETRGRVFQTLG